MSRLEIHQVFICQKKSECQFGIGGHVWLADVDRIAFGVGLAVISQHSLASVHVRGVGAHYSGAVRVRLGAEPRAYVGDCLAGEYVRIACVEGFEKEVIAAIGGGMSCTVKVLIKF